MLGGLAKPNDYAARLMDLYGDDNIIFQLPTSDFEEIKKRFENSEGARLIDYIARSGK